MEYSRNFYEIRKNEEIFKDICDERQRIGYYELPYQEISEIVSYAESITQNNIFVIGIGGSSLGSKSIYKFLKTSKKFYKNIYFLDTIDPLEINYLISLVDLFDTHLVVISKSGDTIEPISIFKYVGSKINISKDNTTIITGRHTHLWNYAQKKEIKTFVIKDNIGGRFSVFSPVGLIPLAMIGVNIQNLLNGCREVHESFFNKEYYYDHIINKARFLVENKNRFVNNILFSYSNVFSDFNKWYVQIWAESLGKKNTNGTRQGLTPIALLGPEDQHSFLQLIMDGVRNKTVTFLKINNLKDSSLIPIDDDFSNFESSFVDGRRFNDLINFQADATYQAIINEKDIPCDIITIKSVDEKNIAILMYRFQLLVSCVGAFLQINAYDQPGVELGKKILRKIVESKKND